VVVNGNRWVCDCWFSFLLYCGTLHWREAWIGWQHWMAALDGSIGWIDMDGIEHWALYVYGWDALHCFFVCVLVHHVRLGKEDTHSIFGRDGGQAWKDIA
jgi:hypothetical protein